MKLSDFILLNEEEKKLAVLHRGVLIAKRISSNYIIFLFQLDHYYVETYCSLQSKSVVEYRVFESTKLLQPYLELISIGDLIE